MKFLSQPIIPSVSASLLLLLFAYTASSKLLAFSSFENVLRSSPLFADIARPVAVLIPATEICIATLLFFPRWRRAGFAFSFILLVSFTIYIGAMLLFASKLPCSCGGVLSQLGWTAHLFFNAFFLLVAAAGYYSLHGTLLPIKIFLRKKQAMLKTCRNE